MMPQGTRDASSVASLSLPRPSFLVGPEVFHPGDLRDEMIQRCERDGGIGRVAGAIVGWIGSQGRITDEKDVEIFRQILVARRCPAVAHVRGIAGQQDMTNALLLEELLERSEE